MASSLSSPPPAAPASAILHQFKLDESTLDENEMLQLKKWITCFALVDFDVEIGQGMLLLMMMMVVVMNYVYNCAVI